MQGVHACAFKEFTCEYTGQKSNQISTQKAREQNPHINLLHPVLNVLGYGGK